MQTLTLTLTLTLTPTQAADGGVLALNSGRAARGTGGGSFGFLTLHPPFAADEPAGS